LNFIGRPSYPTAGNHFINGTIRKGELYVKGFTAKLKCPHGNREDTHGAEAVTEVASDEEGGDRKDH
jgi:hypothetical protein